ncbi:MAG: c-type cytochrome [Chloroflexi bacterium]|nr:c-type cytochrome [Chloroflexota bacterium]
MKRVQLEIVLGTIFVFLSVAIIIVMGLEENQRLSDFEETQRAELIEFGAAVFEINCTTCHGDNAQGIEGRAPCLRCGDLFTSRIAEVGWEGNLEDYIISVVTTGRQVSTRPALYQGIDGTSPVMPTWAESLGGPLRVDQIAAVAAFITNFESWALNPDLVPTLLVEEVDLSDPVSRGRGVFLTQACATCHTITGLTDRIIGPVLDGIGTRADTTIDGYTAEEYIRESILKPDAFIVEGFNAEIMSAYDFGDILTADEINDLIEFLLSLVE